jgi:hypothetical protein
VAFFKELTPQLLMNEEVLSMGQKKVIYRRCIDEECGLTFEADIVGKLPSKSKRIESIVCPGCLRNLGWLDYHYMVILQTNATIKWWQEHKEEAQLQYGIAWGVN